MRVLQDGVGGGDQGGLIPSGGSRIGGRAKGRSEDNLKRKEMVSNCWIRLSGGAGTAAGCAYNGLLLRV